MITSTCACVLLGSMTLAVASASQAHAEDRSDRQNLNGGYFLLHDLLNNEASLPILLDLKTAPKELQDFAVEISRAAKDGETKLEKMRASDSTMSWEKNPLPKIEQDVRTSITGEKQHQLLFGTKGPDFDRALLLSQVEATQYAANIAKVLATQDGNPEHRRDFSRMSDRWHALNEEAFRLLRNY